MKHPVGGTEINEINYRHDEQALITVSKYVIGKVLDSLHDLKNQIDEFDRIIGVRQPNGSPAPRSGPYRYAGQTVQGSPEHSAKMTMAANSSWQGLSPKQRSAEMKRRARVAMGLEPPSVLKPKRLSKAGLKRGSPEFKRIDAYNKRMATAEKREIEAQSTGRPILKKSGAQTRWDRASKYQRAKWKREMKAGKARAAAKARVNQQLLNGGAEVTQ